MDEIILNFALIFFVALVISSLLKSVKIPLIISYIISGFILGPLLQLINHDNLQNLHLFSELGIILLLFIVGLNLNPKVIKEVGKFAIITTILQVSLTFVASYFAAKIVGFTTGASIIIAVSLMFSSTIIILKLLADRRELNKFYSKISIGILIVQDLIATGILIFISTTKENLPLNILTLKIFVSTMSLIIIFSVFNKFILRHILKIVGKTTETLFVFSVTYAFIVAMIFEYANFSKEVGALFAGITLASTIYANEIAARLKVLRDFFVVVFFIVLGTQIVPEINFVIFKTIIILTLLVVVIKPLIVYFLLIMQGLAKKIALYSSLTLGQISEFSLILAGIAYASGQIDKNLFSTITIVCLLTSAISALYIYNLSNIYKMVENISIFFFKPAKKDIQLSSHKFEALIIGNDVMGQGIARYLEHKGILTLMIDHNPNRFEEDTELRKFIYADASDLDVFEELDFSMLKYVFSTSLDVETDILIAKKFRASIPDVYIVITTLEQNLHYFKNLEIDDLVVPKEVSYKHVISKLGKINS